MMNDIFIYAAYSITPKCILALYRSGLTICVTQLLHQMLCSNEQTTISNANKKSQSLIHQIPANTIHVREN